MRKSMRFHTDPDPTNSSCVTSIGYSRHRHIRYQNSLLVHVGKLKKRGVKNLRLRGLVKGVQNMEEPVGRGGRQQG